MGWERWQRHSPSDSSAAPRADEAGFLSGSVLSKCWSMDTCLACSGHSPPTTAHSPELSPVLLSWPPPRGPVAPASGTGPGHAPCRAQ